MTDFIQSYLLQLWFAWIWLRATGRLKMKAAERGISMYKLVLEYCEKGLKEDKDKPKKGGA